MKIFTQPRVAQLLRLPLNLIWFNPELFHLNAYVQIFYICNNYRWGSWDKNIDRGERQSTISTIKPFQDNNKGPVEAKTRVWCIASCGRRMSNIWNRVTVLWESIKLCQSWIINHWLVWFSTICKVLQNPPTILKWNLIWSHTHF